MLSIAGLENVMDVQDAEEANLSCKQDINELEFKWNSGIEDSQNDGLQVSVLQMLRPHRELKSLTIEFYRGITFPSWIGDPSFSKTMYISLQGCTKCEFLPPLGQLPLLKELDIRDMDAVKSMGAEFYYGDSTLEIPFPSLEILSFGKMPEWVAWSFSCGVDFKGLFPRLRQLIISNCPKLVSVPLLRLLSLCDLEIENCDEAVLKCFIELPSLTRLKIKNMRGLTHLPKEFMNVLVSLNVLRIEECAPLVTLWQNGLAPKNLSYLFVSNCENLERLPYDLKSLTSLEALSISCCPKFVSFLQDSLPPTISCLEVRDCDSLESISNCITRLEYLWLSNCSSLSSFPIDTLLSTLKLVHIGNCGNLEWVKEMVEQSIMLGNFGISNWPNLERFIVSMQKFRCVLEYQIPHSLSGNGLLTPNLVNLEIDGFENPFYFPSQGQSLTFLKSLEICNCKSLESFPHQNLPPNLEKLRICNYGELKPLSEWGLQRLFSLRSFTMDDVYPELLSFPDSCFLPATLKSFHISRFWNLKSLSKGLRNLTSLERLEISFCPKFESLSEGLQNLTSLEHLEIMDCPKLGFLPNERILDTLSTLNIYGCPLLEGRYSKENGEDWPKISHIPCAQRRWRW